MFLIITSRSLDRELNLNKTQAGQNKKHDRDYLDDIQQQENYEREIDGYIRSKFKKEYTDFNVHVSKEKNKEKQDEFNSRK